MIIAKGVKKNYGDLQVLKGIDLHISKSEIVSITGKSGAGKSTLLHILGTLENCDSGEIVINNQDISLLKGKELSSFRNNMLGFVFQFHHLLPEFNAIENVCIPAFIKGEKESIAIEKAKELLNTLGLADRMEHKPNELSGGEQQRVAMARALINNPAIIFADEPTGNLDTISSNELHELILDLRDKLGQTFLIVTHNRELAQMSDRQIVMVDGMIS